jgi:hypothetical protein
MIAVIHEKIFTLKDLIKIYEYSKIGVLCILQYNSHSLNFVDDKKTEKIPEVHIWILLDTLQINLNDNESVYNIKEFDGRIWYKVGFLKIDDEYTKIYTDVLKDYEEFLSYGMLYGFPVEISNNVFEFVVDSEIEIQDQTQYLLPESKLFYLTNCRRDSVVFTSKGQISKYPYIGVEQTESCNCIEIKDYMRSRYGKLLHTNLESFLFCQTTHRCFIEVVFSNFIYVPLRTEHISYIYDLDIIRDGDDNRLFCDYKDDIKYNCNKFIYVLSVYDYSQVFDFIDEEYYKNSIS